MENRRRTTLKVNGSSIPLKNKDQYYPEDFIEDMDYQDAKLGDFMADLLYAVPCLAQGVSNLTLASGTQINIPEVRGFVKDSKTIVRPLKAAAQPAYTPTLIGDGVYYVKFAYVELDYGSTRGKVYASESYFWETIDSYAMTIDMTAPTGDSTICVGSFVVAGGVITGVGIVSRSPYAEYNFSNIAPREKSIIESWLSQGVQDKLNASGGMASRLFKFRGGNSSITQLNLRQGTLIVDPVPDVSSYFTKDDGTALTRFMVEQINPTSRKAVSRLTGSGLTVGVKTALSEASVDKIPFVFPSGLNSTTHKWTRLRCHTIGSGYTNLRVIIHDSGDNELVNELVPIGDLGAGDWFNIEDLADIFIAGSSYHIHVYVADGTYVSQPFLYTDVAGSMQGAYYQVYYKPTAGLYPSVDVINIVNVAGTAFIPTRVPGDDNIIGGLAPDERGEIDIIPVDFANIGDWNSWEYGSYVGVDCITGRIKLPVGYSLATWGFAEFNFKLPMDKTNDKFTQRYNAATRSVRDFLDVLSFLYLVDTPDTYASQGNKVVRVKADVSGLEFHPPAFVDQGDVPANYTGAGGRQVMVKDDETGLEFKDGVFTELDDVPSAYSGQAGRAVKVKGDETGLEFVAEAAGTFLGLSDTPNSYTGQGSKTVKVKSDQTGLEFADVSDEAATISFPVLQDESVALGKIVKWDDLKTKLKIASWEQPSAGKQVQYGYYLVDNTLLGYIYDAAVGDYYLGVATKVGGEFVLGTLLSVPNWADITFQSICMVSATSGVFLYTVNSTTSLCARAITISGGIVSLGAEVSIRATDGSTVGSAVRLDGTHVFLEYMNTSGFLYLGLITISGSTLTYTLDYNIVGAYLPTMPAVLLPFVVGDTAYRIFIPYASQAFVARVAANWLSITDTFATGVPIAGTMGPVLGEGNVLYMYGTGNLWQVTINPTTDAITERLLLKIGDQYPRLPMNGSVTASCMYKQGNYILIQYSWWPAVGEWTILKILSSDEIVVDSKVRDTQYIGTVFCKLSQNEFAILSTELRFYTLSQEGVSKAVPKLDLSNLTIRKVVSTNIPSIFTDNTTQVVQLTDTRFAFAHSDPATGLSVSVSIVDIIDDVATLVDTLLITSAQPYFVQLFSPYQYHLTVVWADTSYAYRYCQVRLKQDGSLYIPQGGGPNNLDIATGSTNASFAYDPDGGCTAVIYQAPSAGAYKVDQFITETMNPTMQAPRPQSISEIVNGSSQARLAFLTWGDMAIYWTEPYGSGSKSKFIRLYLVGSTWTKSTVINLTTGVSGIGDVWKLSNKAILLQWVTSTGGGFEVHIHQEDKATFERIPGASLYPHYIRSRMDTNLFITEVGDLFQIEEVGVKFLGNIAPALNYTWRMLCTGKRRHDGYVIFTGVTLGLFDMSMTFVSGKVHNKDSVLGIAKIAGSYPAQVDVGIASPGKTISGLSGLTTGAIYYASPNGNLGVVPNGNPFAKALSATVLQII